MVLDFFFLTDYPIWTFYTINYPLIRTLISQILLAMKRIGFQSQIIQLLSLGKIYNFIDYLIENG